jgi:DNA mismatch endonuclease, patch repair protein
MTDIVSKATRARMMSGIRGKNTNPEVVVRRFLHKQGFRFRLHVASLPGRPDIVLKSYRTCILVHGCFWHRHRNCIYSANPKTRTRFWQEKFASNVRRDAVTRDALIESDWKVIEIWECGVRQNSESKLHWLPSAIRQSRARHVQWPRRSNKASKASGNRQ